MEFKVGDKVKILDRVGAGGTYNPFYFDAMLQYAGTLTSVKEVVDSHSLLLDNNPYYWDKRTLELVNEDEYLHPSELKDGDFIKIESSICSLIYIFKEYKNNIIYRYVSLNLGNKCLDINSSTHWIFRDSDKITYATEEEKKLLLRVLYKEDYIWNNTTKQLLKVGTATLSSDIGIPEQTGLYYTDTAIKPTAIYNGIPIYSADAIANLKEESKEELNLFPTKKHYQLNFNY